MICRIYSDGSYDEGTGDELSFRQGSRLIHEELELSSYASDLPEFWREARRHSKESLQEKKERLERLEIPELIKELEKPQSEDIIFEILVSRYIFEESEGEPKVVRRSLANALIKEEKTILPVKTIVRNMVFKEFVLYNFLLSSWATALYGFWYLLNI